MATVPVEFDAPAERPLVSGTSILLFSTFLAGLACGHLLPRVAQFHAVAAASAGTIAYLGLWYSTLVREQLTASRTNERVARKLERKLGKHLTPRTDLLNGTDRRSGRDRGV